MNQSLMFATLPRMRGGRGAGSAMSLRSWRFGRRRRRPEGGRARQRRAATSLGAIALVALLFCLLPAIPAAAHPLGNFSVNQYSRLEIGTDEARLVYILDLAELSTVADRPLLDLDGNGVITATERAGYLETKLAEIAPALHLTVGSRQLPLDLDERSLDFLPGQAGLETTRLEAVFTAALPPLTDNAEQLTYRNDYAADRLGWREIVAVNGADIRLDDAGTLAVDRSQGLRDYPDDLLSSPLDERSATIAYEFAPGVPAASSDVATLEAGPLGIGEHLGAIVNGGALSSTGLLLALLAAAAWGAVHALSPGHGKTVVGAYLVGSRGTPRHALFLGLTVTVTHTAGVVALGLVILFASRTVMPEQLYPWLSLASGLLVATIGVTILRQRLLGLPAFGHHHHHHDHDHHHAHDHAHDHDHPHDHAHDHEHLHDSRPSTSRLTSAFRRPEGTRPPASVGHSHLPPGAEGQRITWRSLLALGISGGLLPCPSALLALLGAVAVGRAGFGLLVVVAFSLGLAATLTAVGLLFLYAGRMLERRTLAGPWSGALRYAPAVAALAVTASGLMIVARALVEIQRL